MLVPMWHLQRRKRMQNAKACMMLAAIPVPARHFAVTQVGEWECAHIRALASHSCSLVANWPWPGSGPATHRLGTSEIQYLLIFFFSLFSFTCSSLLISVIIFLKNYLLNLKFKLNMWMVFICFNSSYILLLYPLSPYLGNDLMCHNEFVSSLLL